MFRPVPVGAGAGAGGGGVGLGGVPALGGVPDDGGLTTTFSAALIALTTMMFVFRGMDNNYPRMDTSYLTNIRNQAV